MTQNFQLHAQCHLTSTQSRVKGIFEMPIKVHIVLPKVAENAVQHTLREDKKSGCNYFFFHYDAAVSMMI